MQLWIFFFTLFIGSPAPNSYELASVRCHATQSDEKQMSIEVKKKKKKERTQPYYSFDLVTTLWRKKTRLPSFSLSASANKELLVSLISQKQH